MATTEFIALKKSSTSDSLTSNPAGSYDATTGTYTDAQGNQSTRSIDNVPKGTTMIFSPKTSSGAYGTGGGGGATPITTTPTPPNETYLSGGEDIKKPTAQELAQAEYFKKVQDYYISNINKGVQYSPEKLYALRQDLGIVVQGGQAGIGVKRQGTPYYVTPSGDVFTSKRQNLTPEDITIVKNPNIITNIENLNGSSQNILTKSTILNFQPSMPDMYVKSVQEVKRPSGFLEGLKFDIEYKRNVLSTQDNLKTNTIGFGLGISSVAVDTASFFKGLATKPVDTIAYSSQSFYNILSNPLKTGEIIGGVILKEPGYATGIVTGYYLTGKALEIGFNKAITTPIDLYRTIGKTEIKADQIIAPEYFKGQKYPQIYKGEKAGDLLKEFEQGYGFTASPKPINAKVGILKGSSELPGLYQAPKLSPSFLKVSSEDRSLFNLNPFPTLRPTSSKITPTSFELAEGISYGSDVNPSRLSKLKNFFENKAEKGKSYIPFIKSEKESIIPFDTQLEQLPTKSYFKFEGRRIPINEYKTLSSNIKTKPIKFEVKTIENIESGYRSIGSKSYLNPLNLSSFTSTFYKRSSSTTSRPKSSTTYYYNTRSKNIISYNILSRRSDSLRSFSPSISKSLKSFNYSFSPTSTGGGSSGSISKGFNYFGFKGKIGNIDFQFKKNKQIKRKAIKEGLFYIPSFSSRALNTNDWFRKTSLGLKVK